MLAVKLFRGSFCPNVTRVKPNQVADLEIGDREAMVFRVMFILLDHVLKLFMKVLV